MKKLLCALLILVLMLSAAACGGNNGGSSGSSGNSGKSGNPDVTGVEPGAPATDEQGNIVEGESVTDAQGKVLPSNIPTSAVTEMRETFQPDQYVEYCDIFFNKNVASYVGKTVTKEGVFGILQDEYYGGGTRYYVWGYNDRTRCCDFQWEFVPKDPSSLPSPGSYVTVTGVTEQNEAALDKYWIKDAAVQTVSYYANSKAYDYDLTTLSPTLARVQIINMINEKSRAAFEGKRVLVFGRVLNPTTLQHPYYDEAWALRFDSAQSSPVGTYLVLGGTLKLQSDNYTHLVVEQYNEV